MPVKEWISSFQIAAIVGICKNAGKTTLLNHIIKSDPHHRYGVMSTGIDGEDTDTVFKHSKPKLILPAGSVYISDKIGLDEQSGNLEILGYAPGSHANRKLWLVKAIIPVQTRITGPSSVKLQVSCCKALKKAGAEKILIDGSLDRKSIALSSKVDALFLAIGAGYGNLEALKTELRRILFLKGIPQSTDLSLYQQSRLIELDSVALKIGNRWRSTGISSIIGSEAALRKLVLDSPKAAIYIPGAITDNGYSKLQSLFNGRSLIIRHPENLKLSLPKLESLLNTSDIQTLIPHRIKGIALNSWAPGMHQKDAELFRAEVRFSFPGLNLIDTMELI